MSYVRIQRDQHLQALENVRASVARISRCERLAAAAEDTIGYLYHDAPYLDGKTITVDGVQYTINRNGNVRTH